MILNSIVFSLSYNFSLSRIQLAFVRASDIADAHRDGVEQLKSYFGKVQSQQWTNSVTWVLQDIKSLPSTVIHLIVHGKKICCTSRKMPPLDGRAASALDLIKSRQCSATAEMCSRVLKAADRTLYNMCEIALRFHRVILDNNGWFSTQLSSKLPSMNDSMSRTFPVLGKRAFWGTSSYFQYLQSVGLSLILHQERWHFVWENNWKVSSDGKPTMATPWKPGVTSIVWNTKYLQVKIANSESRMTTMATISTTVTTILTSIFWNTKYVQMTIQFGHLFGIFRKEKDPAIEQQQYFLQDLFYLLPYHHLEFPPSLKKLIIIDVDLEFSVDILRLYKYYLKFQFPNSVQPIPANSWNILYVQNLSLEWFLQRSGTFPICLQVRFSPVGSPSPHSTLASLKNTGMKRHKNRNIKFIHWKLLYPGKVILTALLANPVDSRWYFRWQWQKWWR